MNVRLGEWDIRTDKDCIEVDGYSDCNDPALNADVEETLPHSGYNDNDKSREHDIALVRLARNVQFTGKKSSFYELEVQVIHLPLNRLYAGVKITKQEVDL